MDKVWSLPRSAVGGMRERTNRTVSKTVVSQGTVGSNPTPSAKNSRVSDAVDRLSGPKHAARHGHGVGRLGLVEAVAEGQIRDVGRWAEGIQLPGPDTAAEGWGPADRR